MKKLLLIPLVLLSYTLANNRDICEISVENQEGWNLVGLPVYVSDDSYQSVFPGSIENTLFSFSDGTYTLEDELILGEGYWLRFSEDQNDTLIGECMDDFTISMYEGWNLISVVSHPVSVDDIVDTDGIIIDGTVFGFSGGYYEPTIIEPGKGYWVRCYNDGEIIIPEIEETTVTDIDGNVYETVQIGEQIWMAENLKATHYRNGDAIDYYDYDNEPSNSEIYGRLYEWLDITDSRGACPEGFSVPSDEEFMELEIFLGMSEEEANGIGIRGTNEGSKLAGNSELWESEVLTDNPAFGQSGFNALPAGDMQWESGWSGPMRFQNLGTDTYFWTSM